MRTRIQALEHILSCYNADKLGAMKYGGCVYEYRNKNCGIGCLFTPEQIKDIKLRQLNALPIEHVAEYIGEDNIEIVTGMKIEELCAIQNIHDEEFGGGFYSGSSMKLPEYLKNEIAKVKRSNRK